MGRPRRRHHPRGTRRGRPRGSRRGGGTGSLGRIETSPGASSTGGGGGGGGGGTPVGQSTSSPGDSMTNTSDGSFQAAVPTVKRGPGRPRLKPGGPPHQGYRGTPRTRKPIGPLVVPLGQSPAATPLNRSPAMSPAPSPAHAGIGYYQPNDEDI